MTGGPIVVGGALMVGDGSGPLTVDGQAGSFPVEADSYFTRTVHLSALAAPNATADAHVKVTGYVLS